MYVNQSKHIRAQKLAKDEGKGGDEAAIKAHYLKLGGLYREKPGHESEEVEEVQVKRARKSKDDVGG